MNKRIYKRIYIIGSVGSGKTTMARNLSLSQGIPWYELDNIVYTGITGNDKKREVKERDLIFRKIVHKEAWIMEGVYRAYFDEALEKADLIIFLDTPYLKRKFRITKRWFLQRLGKIRTNYNPTFKMLGRMYRWSRKFKDQREHILRRLEDYNDKLVIMRDNKKYRDILSGHIIF